MTTTTAALTTALRACASGLCALEAGVGLLIADGTFLHRDDFTSRFVLYDEVEGAAAIDWDAAITALTSGDLPCSGGERRVLMIAGSLAAGIPVDLSDAVTGLDGRNIQLLLAAIRRAAGQPQ